MASGDIIRIGSSGNNTVGQYPIAEGQSISADDVVTIHDGKAYNDSNQEGLNAFELSKGYYPELRDVQFMLKIDDNYYLGLDRENNELNARFIKFIGGSEVQYSEKIQLFDIFLSAGNEFDKMDEELNFILLEGNKMFITGVQGFPALALGEFEIDKQLQTIVKIRESVLTDYASHATSAVTPLLFRTSPNSFLILMRTFPTSTATLSAITVLDMGTAFVQGSQSEVAPRYNSFTHRYGRRVGEANTFISIYQSSWNGQIFARMFSVSNQTTITLGAEVIIENYHTNIVLSDIQFLSDTQLILMYGWDGTHRWKRVTLNPTTRAITPGSLKTYTGPIQSVRRSRFMDLGDDKVAFLIVTSSQIITGVISGETELYLQTNSIGISPSPIGVYHIRVLEDKSFIIPHYYSSSNNSYTILDRRVPTLSDESWGTQRQMISVNHNSAQYILSSDNLMFSFGTTNGDYRGIHCFTYQPDTPQFLQPHAVIIGQRSSSDNPNNTMVLPNDRLLMCLKNDIDLTPVIQLFKKTEKGLSLIDSKLLGPITTFPTTRYDYLTLSKAPNRDDLYLLGFRYNETSSSFSMKAVEIKIDIERDKLSVSGVKDIYRNTTNVGEGATSPLGIIREDLYILRTLDGQVQVLSERTSILQTLIVPSVQATGAARTYRAVDMNEFPLIKIHYRQSRLDLIYDEVTNSVRLLRNIPNFYPNEWPLFFLDFLVQSSSELLSFSQYSENMWVDYLKLKYVVGEGVSPSSATSVSKAGGMIVTFPTTPPRFIYTDEGVARSVPFDDFTNKTISQVVILGGDYYAIYLENDGRCLFEKIFTSKKGVSIGSPRYGLKGIVKNPPNGHHVEVQTSGVVRLSRSLVPGKYYGVNDDGDLVFHDMTKQMLGFALNENELLITNKYL